MFEMFLDWMGKKKVIVENLTNQNTVHSNFTKIEVVEMQRFFFSLGVLY